MKTLAIDIAGLKLGGDSPIVVQTMCNTHTADIEPSVSQCIECIKAGAQMIRLTTQGEREVKALAEIKKQLRALGYTTPLVADIHFRADVAIMAARVADKVRINPGNFAKDFTKAQELFEEFIATCKEYGTAVRIGLNHGSLGERITNLYGNTSLGMAEAAMEWLRMCERADFHNVVVSLKASNTHVMVNAYRILVQKMQEAGLNYPLHLGVTEAGNSDMGRIKSAVGIGALLAEGIGSTIRVSLTENPANEIAAGNSLKEYFSSTCDSSANHSDTGIDCPAHKRTADEPSQYKLGNACLKKSECTNEPSQYKKDMASIEKQRAEWIAAGSKGCFIPCIKFVGKDRNDLIIKASALFGPLLLDKKIDDFNAEFAFVNESIAGKKGEYASYELGENESENRPIIDIEEFKDNLLQAARRKFTHPEYIACPGCGRTMYNLEQTFEQVKERTKHLAGVRIAVMGCIVNGPGEMADADYGYVGAGRGCVALYKGKERIIYSIPQEEAIDKLLEIINKDLQTEK